MSSLHDCNSHLNFCPASFRVSHNHTGGVWSACLRLRSCFGNYCITSDSFLAYQSLQWTHCHIGMMIILITASNGLPLLWQRLNARPWCTELPVAITDLPPPLCVPWKHLLHLWSTVRVIFLCCIYPYFWYVVRHCLFKICFLLELKKSLRPRELVGFTQLW